MTTTQKAPQKAQNTLLSDDKVKYGQCGAPGCERRFKARSSKIYCSASCRAKAAAQRNYEQLRRSILNGELDRLTETELRALAQLIGRRAAKKKQRPFKMKPLNKVVLQCFQRKSREGEQLLLPTDLQFFKFRDIGRRCRELRAAGFLESERRGRFVYYRLTSKGADHAD